MDAKRFPSEPLPLNKAARCLSVPAGWLREEIEAGRLPGLRAGRAVLVHVPTVAAQLTERAKQGEGGTMSDDPFPIVEKLLTYKQAAELLGVTDRTIWTLVDQGELPAVRFGRSVRIDPADLRAYIDRCKSAAKGVNHDPR